MNKIFIKTHIYLLCFLLILFQTRCSQEKLALIDGLEELSLPKCLARTVSPSLELVLRDSLSYINFIQQISDTLPNNCLVDSLLFLDFSEKTILAKHTQTSLCHPTYLREVYVDTENNAYIYHITISTSEDRNCLAAVTHNLNWIAVPKLPDNYRVQFEVE